MNNQTIFEERIDILLKKKTEQARDTLDSKAKKVGEDQDVVNIGEEVPEVKPKRKTRKKNVDE